MAIVFFRKYLAGSVFLPLAFSSYLISCKQSEDLSGSSSTEAVKQGFSETGQVSYYGVGDGFAGRKTAIGIVMNPNETDKAACRSDLLGKKVTLTTCPKSAPFEVKCVDTGGFRSKAYNSRIMDLYAGAFKKCFGSLSQGVGRVTYVYGSAPAQSCAEKYQFSFEQANVLNISTSANCSATKASFVLLKVEGGKVTARSEKRYVNLQILSGLKAARWDFTTELSSATENFSHIKVTLERDSSTLFETGPVVPSHPIPRAMANAEDTNDSETKNDSETFKNNDEIIEESGNQKTFGEILGQ